MTGRAKRTAAPVSKYEEVASDVDMDEEEKEISATRTAGGRSSSAFGESPQLLSSPADLVVKRRAI